MILNDYRGYETDVDSDGIFRAYEYRSGREVQKPTRVLVEIAKSDTLTELKIKIDRYLFRIEQER